VTFNTAVSLAGFVAVCFGVDLLAGLGYALVVGGTVLFLAGGLGAAREKTPR
jgi:hypothetical protein